MHRQEIYDTIERARQGIYQYLEIMDLFPKVNVAENNEFQFIYKAFYRLEEAMLPEEWYKEYFSIMEEGRKTEITFYDILSRLQLLSNRVDASFSNKLVHTLDTTKPILDQFVYRNTQKGPPAYNRQNRLGPAQDIYRDIVEWYHKFLPTQDGRLMISWFDDKIMEHGRITNLKKIDFILWKWRDEPFIIADGRETQSVFRSVLDLFSRGRRYKEDTMAEV